MRDPSLPPGTGAELDPATRRYPGGLLAGGAPFRVVRLRPAGEKLLDTLVAGAAVPRGGGDAMARRLFDAGLAHPVPPPSSAGAAERVTVVVPVRDRAAGLVATLAALARTAPGVETIVVDDGSTDGEEVTAAVRPFPGISVVRACVPGGPAAARNRGWRLARTDLVAFVDADCEPGQGWLALASHLADPTVGAVAPRVVSRPVVGGRPLLAAYERARSPLDMGTRQAPVRPRSWVPYVPTAALMTRRSALAAVGGFDENLASGEDVDLVWRLDEEGWRVRYQPAAVVAHPARPTWRAWLGQRASYGASAAALAARHGAAVCPADVTAAGAAVWAAVAAGRPFLGTALAAANSAWWAGRRSVSPGRLPAWSPGGLPAAETARLAALGFVRTGASLAAAARREWLPLTLAAAFSRRGRRVALAAFAVPPAVEWLTARPGVDLPRWMALRAVDDAAYGVGVWAGCARERSFMACLPRRLHPDVRRWRRPRNEPDPAPGPRRSPG